MTTPSSKTKSKHPSPPAASPVVWVPQEPTSWNESTQSREPIYDLTKAARFGDLRIALPPKISAFDTDSLVASLRERLADFRAEDYLMAIGSPLVITVAGAVALAATGGTLNLLQWDRGEKQYINYPINLK